MRWLFVAVALSFFASDARADTAPSAWERARDPEAAFAYDLHRRVQERLVRTRVAEVDLGERQRVLAMLLQIDAEHGKSPLLRFDLGAVYWQLGNLEKNPAHYARARIVLSAALAEYPDHPAAREAWFWLALACGHVGDHTCEKASYERILSIETEDLRRVTPLLNLAETDMHLGDLKRAMDLYREVIRISGLMPARETAPLATWGLAVALDRFGDRAEAETQARGAITLERSIGMPNLLRDEAIVFFAPTYEIHWYEGLGAAAEARVATSPIDRIHLWRAAERSFAEYIAQASNTNDAWLPIAKTRFAQLKAEREKAEHAVRVVPPVRSPRASTEDSSF
jgi:tetratricopeptide (TPR) repeat protein